MRWFDVEAVSTSRTIVAGRNLPEPVVLSSRALRLEARAAAYCDFAIRSNLETWGTGSGQRSRGTLNCRLSEARKGTCRDAQ